ncbi:MAG: hypothetical protein KA105_00625 [Caulobacter sp.]|nr:hypothetical protein [Caulobacter sp.]
MTTAHLDRSFSPLRAGASPERGAGRWSHRYGGSMAWPELLEHRRVVILAEASAGKTWELRTQAERLTRDGDAAFFVRIDDLGDGRLEDALDAPHVERFETWKRDGDGEAWFFLDSVDEARLNRKSFDGALRRLGKDLGAALHRARIVISCRASDWRVVEDPKVIRALLPLPPETAPAAEAEPPVDPEAVLLDRIFGEKEKAPRPAREVAPPDSPFVVQLMPLTNAEQRAIAAAVGTPRLDAFMAGIRRFGLDDLAERPGDLLGLATYWTDKTAFGSLVEMTEHAVVAKLAERDKFRPDNNLLTGEVARHGAERLAAALTFGQAFTLLTTGDEADPALAAGALDPALALPELTPGQTAALVRRGVFAPSTYGRLRFHHRGTQEYLAATWLRRLLDNGCPLSSVWPLIFTERYGVETVTPSLRPVAAWLAQWRPEIRDEIVRREPLVLLSLGDPRSLSLATRSALLLGYASREDVGELSYSDVDDRAVWLFSEPALAATLREAWGLSDETGLRTLLLRCIREGRIESCADLALATAIDAERSDTERIIATEALADLRQGAALDEVARAICLAEPPVSPRLAGSIVQDLFPGHLSVVDLVALLVRCPNDPDRSDDISGSIHHALEKASAAEVRAFVYALADAALAIPQADHHDRLPDQIARALKGYLVFAAAEVEALDPQSAPPAVVRLLRALARSRSREAGEVEALQAAVGGKPALNRALFWADVERDYEPTFAPRAIFQLNLGELHFWRLREGALPWLTEDLRGRVRSTDRELALDAIIFVLRGAEQFAARAAWLDELVAHDPHLQGELAKYRTPPPVDPEEPRWQAVSRRAQEKQDRATARNKTSWLAFKADLETSADSRAALAAATSWTDNGHRLWYLALWLERHHEGVARSPLRWRDLDDAFGVPTRDAFMTGMRRIWREVPPERPVYQSENRLTTKNMSALALGGLNLDAAETEGWSAALSDEDVRLAARHGAYAEHHVPEWLDALMTERGDAALPVLVRCLGEEWRRKWGRNELLNRSARPACDAPPVLVEEVIRLLQARDPARLESLEHAVTIIGQRDWDAETTRHLLRTIRRRQRAHLKAGRTDQARLHLALMFAVAPDEAVSVLSTWVDGAEADQATIRKLFGTLFGRDSPLLPAEAWARFSVPALETLLRLAYRHFPPDDGRMRSRRVVSSRNDPDEARNTILSALLQRTGPDVFAALNRLAAETAFVGSARRYRELAHEVAERASEGRPWSEADLVAFERDHTAPVKSGADLLRVVVGILEDIQAGFTQSDGSSAAALRRLETEEEVQNYLAEQLNLRAKGRFHVGRETEVAQGKKPDLVVTSTAAPVQIALEIKHGGKRGWNAKVLRRTLQAQLAEQYLLPENRRQGILVITHHGRRRWQDPETGATWGFGQLIAWLRDQAASVTANRAGGVEARVVGLDPTL